MQYVHTSALYFVKKFVTWSPNVACRLDLRVSQLCPINVTWTEAMWSMDVISTANVDMWHKYNLGRFVDSITTFDFDWLNVNMSFYINQ